MADPPESPTIDIPAVLSPLSEPTRRERRALLLTTLLLVVVVFGGATPTKVEQLGIDITAAQQDIFVLTLVALQAYFLIAFWFYAGADRRAWFRAYLPLETLLQSAGRSINRATMMLYDADSVRAAILALHEGLRTIQPFVGKGRTRELRALLESEANWEDAFDLEQRLERTARAVVDSTEGNLTTETEAQCLAALAWQDILNIHFAYFAGFRGFRPKIRKQRQEMAQLMESIRRTRPFASHFIHGATEQLLLMAEHLEHAIRGRRIESKYRPQLLKITSDLKTALAKMEPDEQRLRRIGHVPPPENFAGLIDSFEHLPKVFDTHHTANKVLRDAERNIARFRAKARFEFQFPLAVSLVAMILTVARVWGWL